MRAKTMEWINQSLWDTEDGPANFLKQLNIPSYIVYVTDTSSMNGKIAQALKFCDIVFVAVSDNNQGRTQVGKPDSVKTGLQAVASAQIRVLPIDQFIVNAPTHKFYGASK
jgi:hypothetical protein